MGEGSVDEIGLDEAVYRRSPVKQKYYKPENGYLSAAAFRPTPGDTTGISLSRARYLSHPRDAAKFGYISEEY